ncbi:MAG: glycosyltransferase [Clostridia bacterium]|nr:glycosyltransferase [Clostridia bacterium]
MKVLWVIGSPRNCIRQIFNWPLLNNVSGGWIDNALLDLNSRNDISIDYVCCSKKAKVNQLISSEKNGSKAFVVHLPKISFGKKGNKKTIKNLQEIISRSHPDIIHIWGSETGLAYDVTKANAANIPTIIFPQGLIGIHSLYLAGQIKRISKIKLGLIGNLLYLKSKIKQKYYKKQFILEKYIALHSLGILTDNDYTYHYYHLLNESIKVFKYPLQVNNAFLNSKWNYNSCEKNTIFTIFGKDLNKGLFILIMAINIVRNIIPNIKVIIPGPFALKSSYKIPNYRLSLFEIWLKKYVKKNNLQNNIVFAGQLTQEEMKENMLKSNLFVNPSCMEVHVGSVREAMYIGMPCISSVCGSVLEFMNHNVNSFLYRYEEVSVLASEIIFLLQNPDETLRISQNAFDSIRKKFESNIDSKLPNIYNQILIRKNEENT